MMRSFLSVVVAASLFAFGACGRDEADSDVEPVEDVMQPAPTPSTSPMPSDSPAAGDTARDTMTTTTSM